MKFTVIQQVNERIAPGADLQSYSERVAQAYDDLPTRQSGPITVDVDGKKITGTVNDFWGALNDSNHKLYKQILSKYDVEFVDEDPYKTAEEMRDTVKKTGVLKIYKGESNHPFFSNEDNWIFRTVHDYYTHIIHGENFNLRGELRAYNTHSKLAPPMALPALFTEVVGQVCYALNNNGKFPEQKMAVMTEFDYKNIGV